MNLYLLFYMAVIIYITIPVCKIIWFDLVDNDFYFLLSTNYLLLFTLSIIFDYHNHLIYSILVSFTLMVFSFLLIRKIKSIFKHYQILSIPYLIFTIFSFSSILCLI